MPLAKYTIKLFINFMALVELLMPKLGESVTEATILEWLKKEGDMIAEEDSVLRIATDKVDSDVPSPYSGLLTKILFQVDAVVSILTPIALIETEPNAATTGGSTDNRSQVVETVAQPQKQLLQATIEQPKPSTANRFYSPLVLNIAREEGIDMNELEGIEGTGSEGRVSKKDILAYVEQRKNAPVSIKQTVKEQVADEQVAPIAQPQIQIQTVSATPAVISPTTIKPPTIALQEGDEVVQMDRMRRMIAEHMVMSKHVSPHVTSFIEVDVTNMVLWRNKIKDGFKKREGENITFTPVFVEAVAKALKKFPYVNASIDGTNVILRKNINIGMATATNTGNLIVSVIKNADYKNLMGLTKEINDLANRGRIGKLKPDETQNGTFTLTNVGSVGSMMGTPIINQPQVAILATGIIKKKPVVLETAAGDVIAIRHMMFMSLSYDHRIVDGAIGGRFLKEVADLLEAFDINREV
jgi:2-oxoglutarate dehydrogenase E2 component (dihydrolipoamide succinyltransferase)